MAHDQPKRYTFPRAFHLKRKRLIRPLFDRSRNDVGTAAAGCVRIVYRLVDKEEAGVTVPLQAGFTTGRAIKRAVDRNCIKRYLREAFRLNQYIVHDALVHHTRHVLTLMVIFRGNPDKARRQIAHHLPTAMAALADKIQEGSMPL